MPKETYYFSHDFDPTGDPKMQALIEVYGGMGYGIFWRMVEMLHADGSHKLPMKKYFYLAMAGQMKTTPDIVEALLKDCINTFELFLSDDSFFWSSRVYRNFENMEETKKVKSNAGRLGGIRSGESRRSKQTEAKRSTASEDRSKLKQNEALVEIPEALVEANEANEAKEKKRKESISNSLSNGDGVYGNSPPPPEMTEIDFFAFKQKLLLDGIFITPLMTTRGIKSENELIWWLDEFHLHITGDGKINKDYGEYRKHFKNWIVKQETHSGPPKKHVNGSVIKKETEIDVNKYRKQK